MGFFNKKLSLEDILNAIDNLSDEEKAQVKAKFDVPVEEAEPEESGKEVPSETETTDKPVEEASEFSKMAEENSGELEEGEEDPNETANNSETVNKEPPVEPVSEEPNAEPVTEPTEVVEQAPEVQEQEQELNDAQSAKIQALEEKYAMLEEKLDRALSALENKDFGLNPSLPEGGGEDYNRMSAVMRGYAGGNAKKYY